MIHQICDGLHRNERNATLPADLGNGACFHVLCGNAIVSKEREFLRCGVQTVAGAHNAGLGTHGRCQVLGRRHWPLPARLQRSTKSPGMPMPRLLDRAEGLIGQRSSVAGIAVGLHPGYAAAQRLYARRGYVPDGKPLQYYGVPVREGQEVRLDNDLTMNMTKELRGQGLGN